MPRSNASKSNTEADKKEESLDVVLRKFNLSSEDLFKLAEKIKAEENSVMQEEKRQELETLKAQEKKLINQHNKALRDIRKQIKSLKDEVKGKKTVFQPQSTKARKNQLAQKVIDMISATGPMSTKEIRKVLEAQGEDTSSISQMLSYLKHTNRLDSPERGVYVLPNS